MSQPLQERITEILAEQVERIHESLLKKEDLLDPKVQSLHKIQLAYLRELRGIMKEQQPRRKSGATPPMDFGSLFDELAANPQPAQKNNNGSTENRLEGLIPSGLCMTAAPAAPESAGFTSTNRNARRFWKRKK